VTLENLVPYFLPHGYESSELMSGLTFAPNGYPRHIEHVGRTRIECRRLLALL